MINKIVSSKYYPDILGDGISYMIHFDFSEANMNDENRLNIITGIASICYQSSKSFGSESLYNRLMAEAGGLPSSSFEFVPMLLTKDEYDDAWYKVDCLDTEIDYDKGFQLDIEKYGEWVEDGQYLLTNFRAAVFDKEKYGELSDFTKRYNTKEECEIIKKHFHVFQVKTDMPTFGQMVRHRVNWQVLSRRYVSGERVAFDFYIADKMKSVTSYMDLVDVEIDTLGVIEVCLNHYKAALAKGIKPQVARGIIPQCAYTVAWCAFQPTQMKNFFKMRCDSHAQWEVRQFAEKMEISVKRGFQKIEMSPERQQEIYERMEDYAKNGLGHTLTKEEMIKLLEQDNSEAEQLAEAGVEAFKEVYSDCLLTSNEIDELLEIASQGEDSESK